jgi:predicted metal-dependent peptidase
MSTSKVKVGCFDTKFYGFHEVRNEYDIEHMPFEGGGGTDFDVAVNAFSRKTVNRIIFTDGYADMPKKPVRAIWVVIGDHTINPDGGKVIYVDRKMLDKKHYLVKK